MAKILGLDLGTNSIGWAITERAESGSVLLDRGVDIFQEGVNRTKSGEEPMVKIRTNSRALRRHYFRRRLRKIELLKVLIANDMCPLLTEAQLDAWRYDKQYPMDEEFLAWQRTDDNADKNPYYDRYISLSTSLDLSKKSDRYTLGRALYHLAQRRGFLSNRKDQSEDNDSGEVKTSISALSEEMSNSGCKYLGEYFYGLYQSKDKIRQHYTSRKEHLEAEFKAICEKQNLSESLQKALHRAIFYQRPLKSQKGLVGHCTFEKNKARCPVSHPRFEEFRMWSFINNIKVNDRRLSAEEIEKILPQFYRKSKLHFDFEDIAKAIAGKKKGAYAYKDDRCDAPCKFNYRMSQSVSGSPVTGALRGIFGEDWLSEICSLYVKGDGKTEEQILNDIWHVLFSFDDDKLREWVLLNLQVLPEQADAFVKIKGPQDYAALSLNAINKMLPFLRQGYRYDEAVFLANLSSVVPSNVWNDDQQRATIVENVALTISEYKPNPYDKYDTKERAIYSCLRDLGLADEQINIKKMYHPSMIELYKDAIPNEDGILQLGSPRTSSIRNPMVMRTLFRLRALVNQLLRDGKIDRYTKINIEFARGLNTANKRKAIEQCQRDNEAKHKTYADAIKNLYKEECGVDITPTEDDILKYQLWEEQNHLCLYTGNQISISDFIGSNPKYDIEHTIPRSRGGDNSQANKTLCQCRFNRDVKRAKLPSELANYAEITARLEMLGWQEKIEDLHKQIATQTRKAKQSVMKDTKDRAIAQRHYLQEQLQYWQSKLQRFTMTEVPEGFSNRQGVDIGIIGKYARMYLKTVFEKIYVVKGETTSDFRKAWGLQDDYEKKARVNHVHHCVDAITIACIGGKEYQDWAHYVSEVELYERGVAPKPVFAKPWPTFTEDVKAVAEELLVSHHTPDNMPKQSKKALRVRGKIQRNAQGEIKYVQGHTARASLHQQTFYGAIKRDDEIKYVVRKSLDSLQQSDVAKIVDDAVRECVEAAIRSNGFKEAMSKPICFNEAKGVYIKKVRIFTPSVTQPIKLKKHRDESRFEYKRNYHVANDGNYCMAIYEGTDAKGRTKRSFNLLNNLEAAKFFNGKTSRYDLVPQSDKDGYPLKCILRTGTMVLFYEKSADELYDCTRAELSKRLYKVVKMNKDGRITFKFHQEARNDDKLKSDYKLQYGEDAPKSLTNGYSSIDVNNPYPKLLLSKDNFNMYVEGYDFDLTVTGDIKFKR